MQTFAKFDIRDALTRGYAGNILGRRWPWATLARHGLTRESEKSGGDFEFHKSSKLSSAEELLDTTDTGYGQLPNEMKNWNER